MKNKAICIFILSIAGFVVDRIFKWLAVHGKTLGPETGGIRFELFPNPAIAFSISFPTVLSLLIIPAVLTWFMWIGYRSMRKKNIISASASFLVVVASFSNYIDRVKYGYVVDYLSLGTWFPVFNVSDVLILTGLVMLLIQVDKSPAKA